MPLIFFIILYISGIFLSIFEKIAQMEHLFYWHKKLKVGGFECLGYEFIRTQDGRKSLFSIILKNIGSIWDHSVNCWFPYIFWHCDIFGATDSLSRVATSF